MPVPVPDVFVAVFVAVPDVFVDVPVPMPEVSVPVAVVVPSVDDPVSSPSVRSVLSSPESLAHAPIVAAARRVQRVNQVVVCKVMWARLPRRRRFRQASARMRALEFFPALSVSDGIPPLKQRLRLAASSRLRRCHEKVSRAFVAFCRALAKRTAEATSTE